MKQKILFIPYNLIQQTIYTTEIIQTAITFCIFKYNVGVSKIPSTHICIAQEYNREAVSRSLIVVCIEN